MTGRRVGRHTRSDRPGFIGFCWFTRFDGFFKFARFEWFEGSRFCALELLDPNPKPRARSLEPTSGDTVSSVISTFTRCVRATSAVALALSLFAACNGSSQPPLRDAQPTARALAQLVLDGIARRDPATLQALALDEAEFKVHVWPSLPAARPERNLPFSYVWGDLRQKSDAALSRTLANYGGRRFELVDVRFGEPPAQYAEFIVHGDTELVVKNDAGAQETIRVCGSLLEKDRVWKVFSYVVED